MAQNQSITKNFERSPEQSRLSYWLQRAEKATRRLNTRIMLGGWRINECREGALNNTPKISRERKESMWRHLIPGYTVYHGAKEGLSIARETGAWGIGLFYFGGMCVAEFIKLGLYSLPLNR